MNSNKLGVELVYHSKILKIDIKDYIEKHSDFLKNEFLKFCKNLENKKLNKILFYKLFETQNNHNLWEMSLLKEKSNLKSDNIFKAILFLAIKKIISENRLKKIIFYNIPIEESIIKLYLENKKIFYEFINEREKKKTIKSFLSNFFLIRFVYYFLTLIIKLFVELRINKFIDKDSNLIIFSYFAHFKNKKNNKITFKQFGNLQNVLKKKFRLDYQYIFVPNKNNLTINTLENKHSILNGNLNFKDKLFIMYKFLIYSFKFYFIKKLILIKLKDYELSLFHIFSRDYDLSFNGSVFVENLIWIEVFENYLSKTSKKKIGIFLLENQAWEKAMITSWKNYNHGKIIGYTPTSINYWHLYNFDISKKNYASPSKIFVSSNEAYKLLKTQYKNKNIKLHKVESLWFNYLINIKDKILSNKENIVLVLGDYNSKNNYEILNIISNSNLNKTKKIFFKPHPHDIHIYKIKNITITNRSNEYFFRKASLIVSAGSTSGILEYLFLGKKVFVYDDPLGFDLSPIKHLNYQFKFKSVKDFNKLLNVNFKKTKITNTFKKYYFLDNKLKKWKSILYI